jgi:tRNA(fMet)-specific endonuclease VapC
MILDTNALSAWMDDDPEIDTVLANATDIRLNCISLGEFRFGILQSRHRVEYENLLSKVESEIATLQITISTAAIYALIRHELKTARDPIPYHDIWIAALAREYRLPILSKDRHFDRVKGVQRIDW